MQVQANGMTLEVEDTGETDRFPVLLVAGIFISVRSSNRQEVDESGNLKS